MCCDPDFHLNFSSQNADVRSGCVLQFAAVIKSIGTDEGVNSVVWVCDLNPGHRNKANG